MSIFYSYGVKGYFEGAKDNTPNVPITMIRIRRISLQSNVERYGDLLIHHLLIVKLWPLSQTRSSHLPPPAISKLSTVPEPSTPTTSSATTASIFRTPVHEIICVFESVFAHLITSSSRRRLGAVEAGKSIKALLHDFLWNGEIVKFRLCSGGKKSVIKGFKTFTPVPYWWGGWCNRTTISMYRTVCRAWAQRRLSTYVL
ncbi:hypothetical protein I7I51_06698, partial [Histoplasma capsulatum]